MLLVIPTVDDASDGEVCFHLRYQVTKISYSSTLPTVIQLNDSASLNSSLKMRLIHITTRHFKLAPFFRISMKKISESINGILDDVRGII